jgi:hypothetical protein
MNPKKMVNLSNVIGFIAVLSLLYWVIIFIAVQVFGLKIFKEHITEIFIYSIIGILVLMSGALIINIMYNLTRIAEKINDDKNVIKQNRKGIIVFLASVPVIICGLFIGNFASAKKVEYNLIKSSAELVNLYKTEIDGFCNYEFTKEWLTNVVGMIDFMIKIDTNITDVAIILEDEINGKNIFLTFNKFDTPSKNDELNMLRYIRNYDFKERQYLEKVFKEGYDGKYFIQSNNSYDLFIPYKNIVLYFSNRQRYGSLSK